MILKFIKSHWPIMLRSTHKKEVNFLRGELEIQITARKYWRDKAIHYFFYRKTPVPFTEDPKELNPRITQEELEAFQRAAIEEEAADSELQKWFDLQ